MNKFTEETPYQADIFLLQTYPKGRTIDSWDQRSGVYERWPRSCRCSLCSGRPSGWLRQVRIKLLNMLGISWRLPPLLRCYWLSSGSCGYTMEVVLAEYALVLPQTTQPNKNIGKYRGGSMNSLNGGFWARILRRGGVRVQVRGNFHILTSKKNKNQPLKGGLNPLTPPPPGSATEIYLYLNSQLNCSPWYVSFTEPTKMTCTSLQVIRQ